MKPTIFSSVLTISLLAAVSPVRAATINFTYTLNNDAIMNDPGDLGMLDFPLANEGIDLTGSFMTVSAANNFTNGNGLPDNGFFAANADHPDIQLPYSNENNGNNTQRIIPSDAAFTITTTPGLYSDIYIFATSGSGDSPSSFTLNYATGAPQVFNFTVDDWFDDTTTLSTMPIGVTRFYLIDGLDRYASGAFNDANDPAIFGYRLASDSARVLNSIVIDRTDTDNSNYLDIMGASGVTVPEPSSTASVLFGVTLLFGIRRRN